MIYLTPYFLILFGAAGIYFGGGYLWTGFLLLFFVTPLCEIIFREATIPASQAKTKWPLISLSLTPVALTGILILAFWRAQFQLTVLETIGLVLSAGSLLGGFGITSAHELVHRRLPYERAVGVYHLMLVNFAHWGLEHVFGHHKHVATPLDPATARRNEWIYPYWVRSYFGVLASAWKISKERVGFYFATTLVVSAILYFVLGLKTVLLWYAISAVAILLLQTVDYIEHYGLVRPKNSDGLYMACKPHHSWDTSSLLTNALLFNLGYHSHHHLKANLPFTELAPQETARKMPFGYAVMVPLALLPFLYIPLMNQRLNQIFNEMK